MMTNYNRRPNKIPLGTALIIVALVALVGAGSLWRAQTQNLLWRIASPVVGLRNALLAGTVDDLRQQLASTTAALAMLDALYQENMQLKAMLGRDTSGEPTHSVLASILQYPPASVYDTVVLDRGVNEGVAVGDAVGISGVVLGEITSAEAHTSRATLYSSPSSEHHALLLLTAPPASLPVVVVGQGAGSFVAQVPAGTNVKVGDSVLFADGKGSLMAKVSGVKHGSAASFMDIYFHVPVNLFEMRYAEVWR